MLPGPQWSVGEAEIWFIFRLRDCRMLPTWCICCTETLQQQCIKGRVHRLWFGNPRVASHRQKPEAEGRHGNNFGTRYCASSKNTPTPTRTPDLAPCILGATMETVHRGTDLCFLVSFAWCEVNACLTPNPTSNYWGYLHQTVGTPVLNHSGYLHHATVATHAKPQSGQHQNAQSPTLNYKDPPAPNHRAPPPNRWGSHPKTQRLPHKTTGAPVPNHRASRPKMQSCQSPCPLPILRGSRITTQNRRGLSLRAVGQQQASLLFKDASLCLQGE